MTVALAALRRAGRPLFSKRGIVLVLLGIVLLFGLIALLAPLIAPHDPYSQNLVARLKPPGTEARGKLYLLGTDELGRDLLSRTIYGFQVSLSVAFLSVLISGLCGTLLGMAAAYFKGPVEVVVMRAADIILSIPTVLLALIIVAVLGPGFFNVVVVLAVTRWPRYARVAFGQTLQISTQSYVRLAGLMGSRTGFILTRHILPNLIGPLAVVATLEFGLMVLFEASLSFLGLGVQPPTASWGSMLSTGRNYVSSAWWIATFPGICLFLVVLVINVLGDRLRDLLDPRTQ